MHKYTTHPPLQLKHSIFYLCTTVLMTVKVKVMGYTALAYSYLVSFMILNYMGMPTNNTNYSCCIKTIKRV